MNERVITLFMDEVNSIFYGPGLGEHELLKDKVGIGGVLDRLSAVGTANPRQSGQPVIDVNIDIHSKKVERAGPGKQIME